MTNIPKYVTIKNGKTSKASKYLKQKYLKMKNIKNENFRKTMKIFLNICFQNTQKIKFSPHLSLALSYSIILIHAYFYTVELIFHLMIIFQVSETENLRKNLAIERMIVSGCDILLDVNQVYVREGKTQFVRSLDGIHCLFISNCSI